MILRWRDPNGPLCYNIERTIYTLICLAEFKELLVYAQGLDFEEEPDYEYIENLLISIKEKHDLGDAL